MASIFSRIIEGEIPAYKIVEDEQYIAFLDVFPIADGHTLVVPKKEVDKLFDLDEETYNGLFSFARKVALALEKTFKTNRVGMSVVGLEVPHAHVHLIPINTLFDMDFRKEKLQFSPEQFQSFIDRIKQNI